MHVEMDMLRNNSVADLGYHTSDTRKLTTELGSHGLICGADHLSPIRNGQDQASKLIMDTITKEVYVGAIMSALSYFVIQGGVFSLVNVPTQELLWFVCTCILKGLIVPNAHE